jgi:hypothetical protein
MKCKRRRTEVAEVQAVTLAALVSKLEAHEPEFKTLLLSLCRLKLARIETRRFDSAELAFRALNADNMAFKMLAKAEMRRVGLALGAMRPPEWDTGWGEKWPFFRDDYPRSVVSLAHQLFDCGAAAALTSKSWKMVKLADRDSVCFFSDAYRLDMGNAHMLTSGCSRIGIDVRIFEWDYPVPGYKAGYVFPKGVKVINWGYNRLYRGKLIGFVLGQ